MIVLHESNNIKHTINYHCENIGGVIRAIKNAKYVTQSCIQVHRNNLSQLRSDFLIKRLTLTPKKGTIYYRNQHQYFKKVRVQ